MEFRITNHQRGEQQELYHSALRGCDNSQVLSQGGIKNKLLYSFLKRIFSLENTKNAVYTIMSVMF